MNYYEHHLGDWAKKCGSLSLIEEGAYRRLLDLYYINEGPLPADLRRVYKDARAHKKTEKDSISFVLREFFVLTERGYLNERAEQEIERFQAKSKKAQQSANARWQKEISEADAHHMGHDDDANAYANASDPNMRTHAKRICESHAPSNQSPVTSIQIPIPAPLQGATPRPSADEPNEAGEGVDLIGHKLNGHAPKTVPDCPHLEILALWAEVMPELPQHAPEMWPGSTRADHLKARWRSTAKLKGWATKAEGLAYFEKLFRWCRNSKFLMGEASGPNRRPFAFELAWLVNATNWTKVHEGKFNG